MKKALLSAQHPHYNLCFCEYALDNKIILVSYPGHPTHLLQPLDVGLFSPLQKAQRRQRPTLQVILKVPGVPLGFFLTILMRYLPSFQGISHILGQYQKFRQPLTLSSFCRLLRTAESFASRPSVISST